MCVNLFGVVSSTLYIYLHSSINKCWVKGLQHSCHVPTFNLMTKECNWQSICQLRPFVTGWPNALNTFVLHEVNIDPHIFNKTCMVGSYLVSYLWKWWKAMTQVLSLVEYHRNITRFRFDTLQILTGSSRKIVVLTYVVSDMF